MESTMGDVKPLINEEESTVTFEVITNDWSKVPAKFNANLVAKGALSNELYFGQGVDMKNKAQLEDYYKKNIDTLTAFGYLCYLENNIMYLISINIDNGQIGAGECNVEKGTSKDYNDFYSEAANYNQLPEGSTEYMIIKKTNDINYSFLGALINGKPCWTYLFKSLTTKYKHLSNCWSS